MYSGRLMADLKVISSLKQKSFTDAYTVFVGCVLSSLANRLCDAHMHISDAKKLWDTLNANFGATDVGSELYVMESFHDFNMADICFVV